MCVSVLVLEEKENIVILLRLYIYRLRTRVEATEEADMG